MLNCRNFRWPGRTADYPGNRNCFVARARIAFPEISRASVIELIFRWTREQKRLSRMRGCDISVDSVQGIIILRVASNDAPWLTLFNFFRIFLLPLRVVGEDCHIFRARVGSFRNSLMRCMVRGAHEKATPFQSRPHNGKSTFRVTSQCYFETKQRNERGTVLLFPGDTRS